MAGLDRDAAQKLDEDLMSAEGGFSLDQLMELAGLSVACSLADVYDKRNKILVFCGPGNNGGDGLVAARHLHHFGYDVSVCYPKQTDRQLYKNLVIQCKALKTIPFLDVPASLQHYGVPTDGAQLVSLVHNHRLSLATVAVLHGVALRALPVGLLVATVPHADRPPRALRRQHLELVGEKVSVR